MEYNKSYEKKKMEKMICLRHTYEYNEDYRKTFGIEYLNPEFLHDELTRLNIFTIIKNEIINVLSVIKKHEYNKNLDSSIVDALFILYNSISNLTNSLKEEIDIHEFNNKLDIYHIAPFLNIIRNNNIFYRIKLNALHSLDHILKYNSSYFNEKMYDKNVSRKQESYTSIENDHDGKSNQNSHLNMKELNDAHENSSTKVSEEKHDDSEVLSSKMSEKMPKRRRYHFFSKNYRLTKKFPDKKEDNPDFLINKGNNIINVSIETLLCAPINYNNINHEEIILYDTIILFNNMLCNSIRVVDRKNIIKIICYIFKIYKNNKYSVLFKGNCESILKNIFYIVMNNLTSSTVSANMRSGTSATANANSNVSANEPSNACTNQSGDPSPNVASLPDDELIHDLLTIILILMNSNKNKFVEDLLKTKECIGMYNDLFENEISSDNMECINVLSFRLLNILLETCGYALINKNFDALSNIIRCLFLHITSSSYILMCRSMRTYINIFILYKKHFCIYSEVFINILLSILKKSSSKNVTETALLTLSYFCLENVLFEIYYNHDVNLYASDLLENFIKAVLDLCVNFINNTTIINDVIFKMVKNILHIIMPCLGTCGTAPSVSNNKSGSNVLNDQNNRMGDMGGYTNQLISEFRNDLYSDIFGYVMHSGKIELLKGTSGVRNWREKCEGRRKIQKEKKKKLANEESGGNKSTSSLGHSNETTKEEKKEDEATHPNDSKKNLAKQGEDTENAPEKQETKKSNMNELYSLNFLTSSKDKGYVLLCSILLCEYVKESIKVDYIKNKEHLMRKKKIRKEILKKSATIFNTLKNKSIDELIKMKMIQTEDTFTQVDRGDSILNSLMTDKREHFTVYANQSYDEKAHASREMDAEKLNSDKANGEPHLTASKNSDDSGNVSSKANIPSDPKSAEKGPNSDPSNPHSAMDQSNGDIIKDAVEQFSKDDNCKGTLSSSCDKGGVDNSNVSDEKRESQSHVESSGSRNPSGATDYDTNAGETKPSEIHSDNVNVKNGENDLEAENKKQKRPSNANSVDIAHTGNSGSQNMIERNSVASNAQRNLMEDPHFLKSIAKFLRYNPFLDKEYVGEYISHRKNINILKSYVRLFDFCNLSLLSSLRLFLHCFKLPGEAQLIERILEHFSLCFFYSNPICGDLDRVYHEQGDKVECLLKEEELANTKRYILIDFLNDSSNEGGTSNGSNNQPSETGESKQTDGDATGEDKKGSPNRKKKKKKNSQQSNVQEKINLKKDVDMHDYIHRNVHSMSKKIQQMSEEEVQKKYVIVENSDVIFILTYSIIMLNTDLHNNQVKNKMKLEEFIKNNRGINNGKNIDRIYLENLYNCILHEEIKLFSNTQSTYTNDNQYWKLLEKRKEQYKNYHSFKAKEVYFYKFDINKLLIKNNFIPIFFEIFKRTNDYNMTENCLSIFKMAITNFAYYHDVENINKLCYIFKYINFYLTQKSQSLLYLLFHLIKRCHNLFRDGWVIYINVLCKLITIDLVPIFFYPHMYINNAQFNNDKDSLHRKYKKGNCLETFNINKSITEIYQHPLLIFKKNIKKINKPKWIDEFSSMFFFRHSNNENSNLSIIFRESYSEKLDEDKKKRKKKEKTQEHENKEKTNSTSIINGDIKQTDEANDDDDHDDDEDSDNDDDENDEDNLNHIYVHIKVDPKNADNSSITDSVTIYKRLKLDVYNFFTVNDFYNNMITNLNITSFIYLIKILMIKSSFTKNSEQHNSAQGSRTDQHNSGLRMHIIPNHNFMTNDKNAGIHNTHQSINDSNPVLINADNSFDLFCNTKEKLLTSQMLFHIIYFKINYTYVLYNMICRMERRSAAKMFKEGAAQQTCGKMSSPINSLVEESLSKGTNLSAAKNEHDKKKKKNRYDLTLNNIYDTDNSTNVTSSDSEFSDISNDSFFIRKNDLIAEEGQTYGNSAEQQKGDSPEEHGQAYKDVDEFDKIYSYAHDDDGGSEDAGDEASSDDSVDSSCDERSDAEADCESTHVNGKHNTNTHIASEMMNENINHSGNPGGNPSKCTRTDKEKDFLMDKIKMNLYTKTYIMHLKITVITFEHFFNLLNKFLLINYDSSIFVSIYNSIFKDYQMEDINFVAEEDIANDHKLSYQIYEEKFENIDKKLHYKEEKVTVNDIEKNLFIVKIPKTEEEEDWLFIEHLIMSIINFSYICFSIYKDDKQKMSKKGTSKSSSVHILPDNSNYAQLRQKNGKFFFLCGIYLMYILQFLKKNILYRFIDKIIYMLEKISKNVYVNSCIINIYLHMLQLITPNNILYKNTNDTNISLNDKDIYIYIEKATIYTESINNIINNNNVLLKLNNFNIENIILSLLPYLLYFNNKKEEINAHIASINSECLHIISNIYYKSTYMYMNNSKGTSKPEDTEGSCQNDNYNSSLCKKYQDNISFENIIELKKMYIFLLICFVLSLACSFSSKRTRSEAYIKLQQFLFNENYIFKKVKNPNGDNSASIGNNKGEKNSKQEKCVYRDEKLIDLISNFIILPLITYNYYFPFICKSVHSGEEHKSESKSCINEAQSKEKEDQNVVANAKSNYCKEALLNFNLYNKRNNDIPGKMWKQNEYENCGCIINYKNIETVDQDLNVLTSLFNYANDYYIHTMLHKQYNYYFSYLYAKKLLSYDNVCYRKSMSISFVSHIILSFLHSLLNYAGDGCEHSDEEKNGPHNDNHDEPTNEKNDSTSSDDNGQPNDINLYDLLCLNNDKSCNKIVTKTKCENNCIFYFLKHFYHALLTIKEETNKILNIYKETFIENIKNIIYVSSSYAYCLKDHRVNCFAHIKNGYSFLNEEEKKLLKPYNLEAAEKAENILEGDQEVFKNISKLQVNVRISVVIVYYILYTDNNQNEQFKNIFEELLNVLLTKYSVKSESLENGADPSAEAKTADDQTEQQPENLPNESKESEESAGTAQLDKKEESSDQTAEKENDDANLQTDEQNEEEKE